MLFISSNIFVLLILYFSLSTNPLITGTTLFLYTLLVSIVIGHFINSWYAILLFLVYVGGILVLFIYVILVDSNLVYSKNFMWRSLSFFIYLYFSFRLFEINVIPSWVLISNQSVNMPRFFLSVLSSILLLVILLLVIIVASLGTSIKIEY